MQEGTKSERLLRFSKCQLVNLLSLEKIASSRIDRCKEKAPLAARQFDNQAKEFLLYVNVAHGESHAIKSRQSIKKASAFKVGG